MKFTGAPKAEVLTLLAGMVAEAAELKRAAGGSVTDAVADWLAPQYLLAAHTTLSGAAEALRWDILRAFAQDWAMLRRGDQAAARLQLDREELDWRRANSQSQKEKEFREWLKRPEIHREIFPELGRGISPETLKKIEKELHLL